ncbi:hypothetical protein [Amycolatopsis samaneae]|uniref:Metal binding domain of Ada n=1 Tax=Amycolatopsis samaneae TaxID=664691 RepID=A0ABW5GUI7_9PSEU
MYELIGPDGCAYRSAVPGTLGGHRRGRLYGRLDCPSALRALARGHYVANRVFFPDEPTAIAAGYRPCAVCLPGPYARWKANRTGTPESLAAKPVLVPAEDVAEYGGAPPPVPHTAAELATIVGLLARLRPRISAVTVGHSRDEVSRSAAAAFAAVWRARGGTVLAVVGWPETAASWLRPANRLVAQDPDAWVFAAAPLGFAQLARRLRHSTAWDPARSVAFASLRDSRVPALAGGDVLHGLRGAGPDGGAWEVRHGWVVSRPLEAR